MHHASKLGLHAAGPHRADARHAPPAGTGWLSWRRLLLVLAVGLALDIGLAFWMMPAALEDASLRQPAVHADPAEAARGAYVFGA